MVNTSCGITPTYFQSMKLFSAILTIAVISIVIISTVSDARAGSPSTSTGTCSFNGAKKLCVVERDTDGTLNVINLSDGKRVLYEFHHDGKGKVYDGNRAYNAAVSKRGDHYIFTT